MLIILVLLVAMGASAQTAPDARDLLVRSDAPIVAARTFRVEGTLVVEASGPGTALKIESSFSTAYSVPGRHWREVRTGQAKTVFVFDGAFTWTYYPEANRYSKSAGGTGPPPDLQLVIFGRNQANLRSAAVQREESVPFGGSPVMCFVVRAEYAGPTDIAGYTNARNVVRTAWIEPVNNLVLRDSWEADALLPGVSTDGRIRLTQIFTTIEWDRPLAEDLFAFQPPEGSRPILSFVPPGAIVNNSSPDGPPSIGPGSGGGTSSGPSGVFRVGGGVTAPSLRYKAEPEYSEEARKARYQGTVLLYVQVDPFGKTINMRVLRSLGFGLDEKAMEAVKRWEFRPGFKDGQPVTVEAQIEVNFRLLGPWRIVRQEYASVAGASKPVPRLFAFPPNCQGNQGGVTLSVLVGADGNLSNVQVIRSTRESLEQPAIDSVQRWAFLPARLNGAPQAVSGVVELECRPGSAN